MGLVKLGMVLTMLGVVVVYGSWAMTRAVDTAESQGKLSAEDASHQRSVFGRVRHWSIRGLLVAVWVVAAGLVAEVLRRI